MIRKESNHNMPCSPTWEELDPIDDECVNSPLTGKQIELMRRALSTLHKDSEREWRVKTGSRPGDVENYSEFESRDSENFARHNEQLRPMTKALVAHFQASVNSSKQTCSILIFLQT